MAKVRYAFKMYQHEYSHIVATLQTAKIHSSIPQYNRSLHARKMKLIDNLT